VVRRHAIKKLEQFFYEAKPFICLALAVYAFASPEPNRVALLCGLALLIAGTFILRDRLKARRGSALEMVWYEAQPFLYLGVAGYVLLFQRSSKVAVGFAMLLLFCATMILQWRYKNRSN
jgi:uncharacterized membrane protein HdeD (DUF308 family)